MIKSLGELDLYKVIILLSIVLIPGACVFVYLVNDGLAVARESIDKAVKRNGELELIGHLEKKFELLKRSSQRAQSLAGHTQFFENAIMSAATDGIKVDDMQIGAANQKQVSKPKATDEEVDIKFMKNGKTKFPLPRDFINAVLFNCEATSRVWKLRQLKMSNEEVNKGRRNKGAPPRTVRDTWLITSLKFARRMPDQKRK